MKKLVLLLAVLALAGCEGSGSSNNNPAPDNDRNVGNGGNGDANISKIYGEWIIDNEYLNTGYDSVTLKFQSGMIYMTAKCFNTQATVAVTATYTTSTIVVPTSKESTSPNCPVGISAGTYQYTISENTIAISLPNQSSLQATRK